MSRVEFTIVDEVQDFRYVSMIPFDMTLQARLREAIIEHNAEMSRAAFFKELNSGWL